MILLPVHIEFLFCATLQILFLLFVYQVENGFILPIEKEIFIDQLKDIVDKAEDILSEDMDGEKISDFGKNHLQGQTPGDEGGEVLHGSWSRVI